MALPEFLDVSEVAKYLKLNPETVKVYIRKGKLRAWKAGNRWRLRVDELFQDLANLRDMRTGRPPRGSTDGKK